MKPFRFSPISNKEQLLAAINHIHAACHALCKQLMGHHLPVAGNIGIFCHYDDEYTFLTRLRAELTDLSDSVYGKYFRLYEPCVIPATDTAPAATYTHLYIRKPDALKPQVGDIDFFLEPKQYARLKQTLQKNPLMKGMKILNRPDLDLIELYDAKIDALGYIGDKTWR